MVCWNLINSGLKRHQQKINLYSIKLLKPVTEITCIVWTIDKAYWLKGVVSDTISDHIIILNFVTNMYKLRVKWESIEWFRSAISPSAVDALQQ